MIDMTEIDEDAPHPKAGFRRCVGQRYTEFLDQLHIDLMFDWSMEIGCRAGRTFGPTRSNTIAVDPFFKAEQNIINAKKRLFVFQETSDDFFAHDFLKTMKIKLSFAFLDGMHLFEFLLRDFLNTEANSRPDGVIALHDCLPFKPQMLTRDLDNLPRGPWTGDVWKLIPILQKYRPDLKITALDARPTGLVLVSNLKPTDKTLSKNYDKIIAEWETVDLVEYGAAKFNDSFERVDPQTYAANGYPDLAPVAIDQSGFTKPKQVTK